MTQRTFAEITHLIGRKLKTKTGTALSAIKEFTNFLNLLDLSKVVRYIVRPKWSSSYKLCNTQKLLIWIVNVRSWKDRILECEGENCLSEVTPILTQCDSLSVIGPIGLIQIECISNCDRLGLRWPSVHIADLEFQANFAGFFLLCWPPDQYPMERTHNYLLPPDPIKLQFGFD